MPVSCNKQRDIVIRLLRGRKSLTLKQKGLTRKGGPFLFGCEIAHAAIDIKAVWDESSAQNSGCAL